MTATWLIEKVETTEGSAHSTVAWRVNDGQATAYGTVSIEGLTITPQTTEAEVITKVKAALNAVAEQRDERNNLIPPKPGEETAKTDAIEKSLAEQAHELANPKTHSVDLPWKRA